GQDPVLNSGNATSLGGVLDMLARKQYPVRTPFDDPTVVHGAANPGRTLTLTGYQLANFAQYLDWQWAAGVGDLARFSPARAGISLAILAIGVFGIVALWRRNRSGAAFVVVLFVVAGPLFAWYLNFKPGPSIGWNHWLSAADHEVRDRDYFFGAAFTAAA